MVWRWIDNFEEIRGIHLNLLLSKKEKPGLLFILLCIYKLVYTVVMIDLLPEYWSGVYDFDKNISVLNVFLEIIPFIICVIVYIIYFRKNSPLSFFITLFFCLYVVPNNSILVLSNYDIEYYFLVNIYSFLCLLLLGRLNVKNSAKTEYEEGILYIWDNKKLIKILRITTYIVCIITIIYVYLMGGLNFKLIFSSSSDMYDVRSDFAEFYAANTNSFISYFILIWTAVYTFMLLIGLYVAIKKNYIMDILICIFTYMALYTLSMEKGVLLRPIIVIFVVFLEKKGRIINASHYFWIGVLGVIAVSFLEPKICGTTVLFDTIIKRVTYLPAYLTHAYYEFFHDNHKVWFTVDVWQLDKITRLFLPKHYYTGIVTTISNNCFPGIPSPNTGLFAEAYAQAGIFGVVIFPPIVTAIISFLNNTVRRYGMGCSMVILASFCLSLTNIQILSASMMVQVIIFALITYVIKYFANYRWK